METYQPNSTMIEGLKVTLSAQEVRELCLQRAAHHAQRATVYREQLANLQEAQIEGMNYSGGNPRQALQDRLAKHEQESEELTFIGEHLDETETYLLDRQSLVKLGICESLY